MTTENSESAGNLALYCDQYVLTMAQSFYQHQQDEISSFEVFVRSLPKERGYLVVAGLQQVLDYLQDLRFTAQDVEYLRQTGLYHDAFLNYLSRLRFHGDVEAIPEGTVTGAGVPFLRLTAHRIEATLVESAILSILNHQTMVASKASRIVGAAGDKPVFDFSLRRVHGPLAALGVARAAYIAGCAGTATVAAGKAFGIPTVGTMAHQFILAFGEDKEQQAFEQFLLDYPQQSTLLVDTYDVSRGMERAIAASKATNVPLTGVRLDSGDLAHWARIARSMLDASGQHEARIIASNDLDEYSIEKLVKAEAPIDAFGVGTMLGTSADAPSLGGVYKLVEQGAGHLCRPIMKRSDGKTTDPGKHQVFRYEGKDVIGMNDEDLPGLPLLHKVMHQGKVLGMPSLEDTRQYCALQRQAIPSQTAPLHNFVPWKVERSPELCQLRAKMGDTTMPLTEQETNK